MPDFHPRLNYYFIKPAQDRNHQLLEDLQYHKLHVRDLPKAIQTQTIIPSSNAKQNDLIKFPKFTTHTKKILIEF